MSEPSIFGYEYTRESEPTEEQHLAGVKAEFDATFKTRPPTEEEERLAQSIFSTYWTNAIIRGNHLRQPKAAGAALYFSAVFGARIFFDAREFLHDEAKPEEASEDPIRDPALLALERWLVSLSKESIRNWTFSESRSPTYTIHFTYSDRNGVVHTFNEPSITELRWALEKIFGPDTSREEWTLLPPR